MAKLITMPGARPADEGEALVVRYLEEHLPNTYTLFPNVEIIEKGRPAFEYDLIVLAPHAVYVVEVKRWRGGIRGDDYNWVVRGQRRQNPWPTANNKARVLKSQLERRQPAFSGGWVEAVVAIADEQGELELRGQCRERVFRYTDLPAFLTDAEALGPRGTDLRPLRGYLETTLQEIGRGRPVGPLHFGNYEVLETLSRRDLVAEYLAKSLLLQGDERVRLRVFSYDPYLEPTALRLRQEAIRREAEALRKIGPHPNLIALKEFTTAPEDPNLFIEVTDWSDQGTLRTLMEADLVSRERTLDLALGIAAGLKAVHDAGVIHRDVQPDNILIGRDGQPKLMNFDRARLSLPQAMTVSGARRDPDVPRAYMAPELLNPAIHPIPATDLYSLGMILFEMLVGEPLYDAPEAAQGHGSISGPATFGVADIPAQLNELACRLLNPNPTRRPQSADEVMGVLQELRTRPSGTIVEPAPAPSQGPMPIGADDQDPAVFQVNQIIDGKYPVRRVMGGGGSGKVYEVYDEIFDRVCALKVFSESDLSLDFIKQEARTLKEIKHRNIVQVYGWGRLSGSGRLYLLSEFVDGDELTKFTTPDQLLPVREAVQAVLDLLSALEDLHPNVDRIEELRVKMEEGEISEEEFDEMRRLQGEGWLHRDIKPANLMRTKTGLKVVDFNIAARAGQAGRTVVGTYGYMLPDIGIMPWSADGDLFATGVVLYELVTGYHPYPDRQPNAEDEPMDPRQYIPDLHPQFAELLVRAVSCDSTRRYHSARRFRQDLLGLDGVYLQVRVETPDIRLTLEPWEVGKPNYNPYVTRLLTLYSQARRDNSGTRGLDEIARLTYVPTRLDRLLLPAVRDAQYRLVIITGNAGDGKTAFIKKLEESVRQKGAEVAAITPNSSTFFYQGVRFYTNYDGSQDEGDARANDTVLTEFFAPFADPSFDRLLSSPSVHVIAINEGRLVDFFTSTPAAAGQPAFERLGRAIISFFDPDQSAALPDWLLIVDLNQRSVVAVDDEIGKSIFGQQLEALLKPEFWEPCEGCALRQDCFIKYNADTLAEPGSGPMVQERLRTLFEVVHLRRQKHITMRDMRSALSWMLLRDQTCDDVAALVAHPPPPQTRLNFLYANAYAQDGGPPDGQRDDRLVEMLRQVDPAQVANPTDDRLLHFQGLGGLAQLGFEKRSLLAETWLAEWDLPSGWEVAHQPGVGFDHVARHAILRRLAFFERRDTAWRAMLPYQKLEDFQQWTKPDVEPTALRELLQLLVEGISTAEGARHTDLISKYLYLRAGGTNKAPMKSFRLFPITDFQLEVPRPRGDRYLEYTPDRIVFYHNPVDPGQRVQGARRAELGVSLDLLELLAQTREGYMPSTDDISGFFINLVMFKNALAHLPYTHGVLTRDDQHFYEVTLDDQAIITLRPWSAERIAADGAQS